MMMRFGTFLAASDPRIDAQGDARGANKKAPGKGAFLSHRNFLIRKRLIDPIGLFLEMSASCLV
jgi:hypothetical protein